MNVVCDFVWAIYEVLNSNLDRESSHNGVLHPLNSQRPAVFPP